MMDAIGTLRLALPGSAEQAHRAGAVAAEAVTMAGLGRMRPAPAEGEKVLLVRQLSLGIRLSRTRGWEQVGAAAGRSLEPAVRGCLARSDPGLELITFDSSAEYVAHFIEQCLYERPLDIWYFRPLSACVAPALEDTLRHLAEAEPGAWTRVLALLRSRGLLPRLLRRLPPEAHGLLFAGPSPPRRLDAGEARPLFLAAWRIVSALLGAPTAIRARGADGPASPAEDGWTPGGALSRFLATGPHGPRTWSDRGCLGEVVASMVTWLLEQRPGAPRYQAAARVELAALSWLDPSPVELALGHTGPRHDVPSARLPIGSSTNRAQALRYLEAAVSPSSGGPERDTLDAMLGVLLHRSASARIETCEELLVSPALEPSLPPSAAAALRRLRSAARSLTRGEVRALAGALAKAAAAVPDLGAPTAAAGVLLLIRPLIDLRFHLGPAEPDILRGLLRETGALAAGSAEDIAVTVLATGEWPRETGAVGSDAAKAESLELPPRDRELPLPGFTLALACRQLVRWLRGFERSSTEFVLEKMLRRPGHIQVPPSGPVAVRWPGSGFDLLLDRAGYLAPLDSVPWWTGRGLTWVR